VLGLLRSSFLLLPGSARGADHVAAPGWGCRCPFRVTRR